MKFSEVYNIEGAKQMDWFDPILTLDTFLFVDPFLLYDLETDEFEGSHDDVIQLFNSVFQLVAQSNGDKSSSYWKKVEKLLLFPEVEELCLGYAGTGTGGSGSGTEVAKLMTAGIWNAIRLGKQNLKHFEEVQLFHEGIGRDRISDATAKIIRRRLAAYTLRICEEHNIDTQECVYPAGYYDPEESRWKALQCQLPMNPYNNKPVLLVPKKYLNSLPTINPDDFWAYCYGRDNQTLRDEFGEDITKNVDKNTILDLVSKHINLEEEYIDYASQQSADPYNLNQDPQGVYNWYELTQEWVRDNPIDEEVFSQEGLLNALNVMLDRFEHFIMHNGGWELLWNDNNWTAKREGAVQTVFLGIVKHYCAEKDIDISKEPNIGRGPVDFKISHGHKARALIEVKKANNTKFWNGLEKQLPTYQKAEGVNNGCFLVVCYSDEDFERIKDIEKRVKTLNENIPYEMSTRIIDATRPLSASLL